MAACAYLAYLTYLYARARKNGLLRGKPAYEAKEMLGHRIRGVSLRTTSMREWGDELLRAAQVPATNLQPDDVTFWRAACARLGPLHWEEIRGTEGMNAITQAFGLLSDWLYQIKTRSDGDPADSETHRVYADVPQDTTTDEEE